MTLQLADSSVRIPLGIVEHVSVLVGKVYVPVDSVVIEMEEDNETLIILGRPFFKTTRIIIDVDEGTLTLRIGGEKVQYRIDQAMKHPDQTETCSMVEGVSGHPKELERGPNGSQVGRVSQFEGLENRECGSDEVDARVSHGSSTPNAGYVKAQIEPLTPELKPLPTNLSYEFPDPNKSYLVILKQTSIRIAISDSWRI